MTPIAALLLALSTSPMAACQGKPDAETGASAETPSPNPRARIIEEIPTLAAARQIDTTGSADAEHQTWRIEVPFEQVTAYYRRMLPNLGWAVMNDQADANEVNLYTRKGSAAVWMHFERKSPTTTEWTIIGADSASAGRPAPAAAGTPRP